MDEHRFAIAPAGAPRATVLIVPPLFEEANRTRRTLVLAMRALAGRGFAAVMPDLPGQNESVVPLVDVDLESWQAALVAVAAAIDGPLLVASVRGGALIDHRVKAAGWWRLAPVGGASLLRTLLRARVSADREAGVTSSLESLTEAAKRRFDDKGISIPFPQQEVHHITEPPKKKKAQALAAPVSGPAPHGGSSAR